MIVCKIQAGLGNQLFQWAVARSYAIDHNCEYKFETSFYPTQTKRQVKLNEFNIKFELVTQLDINRPVLQINDTFNFIELPYDPSNIIFLNGYWQSEKYFSRNSDVIRNELLSGRDMSKLSKTPFIDTNTVSIHIRRTDYTESNGYHPVQSMEYYEKAIAEIGSYDKLFVFSDDINWCKENLKFRDMIFMEGFTDIEDLFIMSMCKNNIIANSSFSWWGAWLNNNPNKKVVAPINWFGQQANISTADILPENWIKI